MRACLQGFNSTVFCYGPSGTGKSFTCYGPEGGHIDPRRGAASRWAASAPAGIIPRAAQQLFESIRTDPALVHGKFVLRVSFLQLYREQIGDLLSPHSGPLNLREDPHRGVFVEGITEVAVRGPEEVRCLGSIFAFSCGLESVCCLFFFQAGEGGVQDPHRGVFVEGITEVAVRGPEEVRSLPFSSGSFLFLFQEEPVREGMGGVQVSAPGRVCRGDHQGGREEARGGAQPWVFFSTLFLALAQNEQSGGRIRTGSCLSMASPRLR